MTPSQIVDAYLDLTPQEAVALMVATHPDAEANIKSALVRMAMALAGHSERCGYPTGAVPFTSTQAPAPSVPAPVEAKEASIPTTASPARWMETLPADSYVRFISPTRPWVAGETRPSLFPGGYVSPTTPVGCRGGALLLVVCKSRTPWRLYRTVPGIDAEGYMPEPELLWQGSANREGSDTIRTFIKGE